jgi:hypothetical protein
MPFLLLGLFGAVAIANAVVKDRASRADLQHERRVAERLMVERTLLAARENQRLLQTHAALDTAKLASNDPRWHAFLDLYIARLSPSNLR